MNSTANSYSQSYAPPDTLLSAALAPLDWTRSISLVVAFSLLTALAAQVVIPIGPVPITGQTFAVLLTGALLGSRLGAMAMIVYWWPFRLELSSPELLLKTVGTSTSQLQSWRWLWVRS